MVKKNNEMKIEDKWDVLIIILCVPIMVLSIPLLACVKTIVRMGEWVSYFFIRVINREEKENVK